MKRIEHGLVALMMLAMVILASGCGGGEQKEAKKNEEKKEPAGHPTKGPHKGPLAEWGEEEYHVEFTVDPETKTVKVYILDGEVKDYKPLKVKTVKLTLNKPAFQIDLTPEPQDKDPKGSSSCFKGTDDRFGNKQNWEGTVSADIDGKQYNGDFKYRAK